MEGPLADLLPAVAGVILLTWGLSVLTGEYSWVDRLWSILPPVYVGWFAWSADLADTRLNLMTVLVALWGARLTFNFWRKGGYAKGGEDYRWAHVRQRLGPVGFQVFNATFVAPYQNVLLLLIAAPAHTVWQHRGTPLGPADVVLAALFLVFLAGETLADQQQWSFQTDKAARIARGEAPAERFATRGLFAWSRHPNFLCEMAQWCVIYAFAVVASGRLLHWTLIGPVLLILLFDGSTRLTEALSLAKYPEYADYRRRTSRWLPWPPRT